MTDRGTDDGYPTEDELKAITDWKTNDLPAMFAFIQDLWCWGDTMATEAPKGTWTLITGGWSGNEDLIGALSNNHIAWSLCWEMSKRGGKHVFVIPERLMESRLM